MENYKIKENCRIIIGLDCNYKCEYCSNEIPYLIKKFVPTSIDKVLEKMYMNISLTGGEPLLPKYVSEVLCIVRLIKKQDTNCKVFIYSNLSVLPPTELVDIVDGWSIGFHPSHAEIKGFVNRVNDLIDMGAKKVRVLVENLAAESLLDYLPDVAIKSWIRNDCDKTDNEDWYLLE